MKSERVTITANGEHREIRFPCSVTDFLASCDLKTTQVVVEHNGRVLPRADFAVVSLNEGDRIEVILPVAGG